MPHRALAASALVAASVLAAGCTALFLPGPDDEGGEEGGGGAEPAPALPPDLGPPGDGGAAACGEAQCRRPSGAYISHFTGPGCTGTESYYTPYFSGTFEPNRDGRVYPWDGNGAVGTTSRTLTNRSYRTADGACHDAWPEGNTLDHFVLVYR